MHYIEGNLSKTHRDCLRDHTSHGLLCSLYNLTPCLVKPVALKVGDRLYMSTFNNARALSYEIKLSNALRTHYIP